MVEIKTTDKISHSTDSPIVILREAEQDARLEKYTEYQHVNLDQVEIQLKDLETEDLQLKFFQAAYPCLYFLVCDTKGYSTQQYKDDCKLCEEDENLMCYYIHGWFYPLLDEMRA